jgi:heterodisulfide reductase subunit A
VASIAEEKCSGCRVCNGVCPFNAIDFVQDEAVSRIESALCKGCGTCVAACPAQAITGAHFSHAQIMAEIGGLLSDGTDGNGGRVTSRGNGSGTREPVISREGG